MEFTLDSLGRQNPRPVGIRLHWKCRFLNTLSVTLTFEPMTLKMSSLPRHVARICHWGPQKLRGCTVFLKKVDSLFSCRPQNRPYVPTKPAFSIKNPLNQRLWACPLFPLGYDPVSAIWTWQWVIVISLHIQYTGEKMPPEVLIWAYVVSLWPWQTISKSSHFTFVPNCTKVVNLVIFSQAVDIIMLANL